MEDLDQEDVQAHLGRGMQERQTGVIYQKLVNKMFKEMIGKIMEVYIDDMLVKSLKEADRIAHLEETIESFVPVKIGIPSFKTSSFDKESNEAELRLNLDLLDERRERAEVRQAFHKHQVAKYYNQRVKHMSFLLGDLVLRKVILSIKELNAGKLGLTWEGTYKVVKVSRPETY
ncbi:uncharacterized protein LOC130772126 [Actinidia eriantha]|uniref:uncharacterized protein LOC130772126 n=1 Tax=Actinidia eriantha TaxID=165200 RepID=UPI002585E812|nr:uncharacterized protein LOC130772126 [Actinidia eriantha]